MQNILDCNLEDIKKILIENGIKGYVANQVYDFIHNKLVFNFDEFHNIKIETREKLKELFYFTDLKLVTKRESKDKLTTKYLFKLNDKMLLETVLLTHNNRKTLCVSSQIGCPLKCDFCATGTMRFEKNLTASEIFMQYYLVQKDIKEKISNLVYMGMGEPFLNYDNVVMSINVLNDSKGQNISKRNFTISTSGLCDEIVKLANDEKQVHLAISLHSAIQETRDIIMPINRKYNLNNLKKALLEYQRITKNRITFEYILIDELNISDNDAYELIKFSRPFNVHINLIPYNIVIGKPYKTPSRNSQKNFYDILKLHNLNVTLRETKGQDIAAACGQLKVIKEKKIDEKNN